MLEKPGWDSRGVRPTGFTAVNRDTSMSVIKAQFQYCGMASVNSNSCKDFPFISQKNLLNVWIHGCHSIPKLVLIAVSYFLINEMRVHPEHCRTKPAPNLCHFSQLLMFVSWHWYRNMLKACITVQKHVSSGISQSPISIPTDWRESVGRSKMLWEHWVPASSSARA